MNETKESNDFWWHLDILRSVLLKILLASFICGIIAFIFKEQVFEFVLAPKSDDFITYDLLNKFCRHFNLPVIRRFEVQMINTGLAQQFIIHMKTAMCIGILCVSPYIIYELFSFISPALYKSEKRLAIRIVTGGYLMFIVGIAFNYLLIFPLTFHFLGTYQVDKEVINLISLDSYMGTLIMMSICMGIVFEIPVIAWLSAKMGLITDSFLKKYRRHALVAILIVAAIITPTSDVFTLILVSLPMYLLYEVSILVIRPVNTSMAENYKISKRIE